MPLWRVGVLVSSAGFDDVFCPMCGARVKWACPVEDGAKGDVHCDAGRMVSQYVPTTKPRCLWNGATCIRRPDGEVITGPEFHGAL
jgi:hypothetical protein